MMHGAQNPPRWSMRVGKRQFRPRLWPTIATLVLLPILIALGFWQLDRAQEKREIQQRFEQRTREAPLVLGARLVDSPKAVHYRRATARGVFDAKHQLLIDNKVYEGKAGYDVLTPLRIQGTDTWVLVNRGWVPQGRSRKDIPTVPVPEGTVEVHGLIELPDGKPLFVGGDYREGSGWPSVALWLDLARYAKQTGYRVQPFELLQDPKDPGNYPRQWQIVTLPPEKSVSYAVQWFTMAAALVIIYIVVNLRRTPTGGGPAGPSAGKDETELSEAGESEHD
ncbi:MAG: SURF1 family protein [Gammaproteobacteria bacterium]